VKCATIPSVIEWNLEILGEGERHGKFSFFTAFCYCMS
jgi:hypothetical protein